MATFYVIEVQFDADGTQTASFDTADFPTFAEAQAHADHLTDECGHPCQDGSYATWHVQAEG